MAEFQAPFYPIIYLRGFAGNDDEIAETVADPYMGFNKGSTKFRQSWTGDIQRYYFESPLYRLTKDYDYKDVYSDGEHLPPDPGRQPQQRSIVIYRYYDEQFYQNLDHEGNISEITGKRRDIEEFADGLSDLLLTLKKRMCRDDNDLQETFRVYLVAHSMGGLICRCFLQNDDVGDPEAKRLVDKVFTYATPHGGIDFRMIGNVPGLFSINNVDNFNEQRMKEYLGLPADKNPKDLNGKFDASRFFCLVGTNRNDYTVASGWSRRVVGPMSDGLVRIVNATTFDSQRNIHSPRAFVYRSHSGHFGIVNSEDGYQNLIRFLFGDIRVDGILKVESVSLPAKVQTALDNGETIKASYHFEAIVRVRGADWDLHRRTAREESAIFRTFNEILPTEGKPRSPHLFSAFLMKSAIVGRNRSMFFTIEMAIQVPEYEIDGLLFFDQKIRGSYLFRDTINIQATPSTGDAETPYNVRYGFDSKTPLKANRSIEPRDTGDLLEFDIPLDSKTKPGFKGTLVLQAKNWN